MYYPFQLQSLGTDGLEQLDIAWRASGYAEGMNDTTACTEDPFCESSVDTFKNSVDIYLDSLITNVTLAGVSWRDIGQPDGFNTSWVRGIKGFYRHVCVVHEGGNQWVCMNMCSAASEGTCCPGNECGVCGRCFGL